MRLCVPWTLLKNFFQFAPHMPYCSLGRLVYVPRTECICLLCSVVVFCAWVCVGWSYWCTERWVVCFRAASLPLLWVVTPLSVVELLYILGATSKVCWVLSSTVDTFWGGAGRFWAIFRCVLLIAFYALGGSAAEGWRLSERLAVETLADGSWVLIFFPFNYTMAQFMELENFSHISSWLER